METVTVISKDTISLVVMERFGMMRTKLAITTMLLGTLLAKEQPQIKKIMPILKVTITPRINHQHLQVTHQLLVPNLLLETISNKLLQVKHLPHRQKTINLHPLSPLVIKQPLNKLFQLETTENVREKGSWGMKVAATSSTAARAMEREVTTVTSSLVLKEHCGMITH